MPETSDFAGDTTLWTVGDVSELTRVSVRTLHHYDHIGLLKPSERSESNYRLYTMGDLERLWRILTYRELGFSLVKIHNLMNAPPREEIKALHMQKALLLDQKKRIQTTLEAIEAFLNSKGALNMNNQNIKDIFDGFDHSKYEQEAQQRWGQTDAYRQSAARTQNYTQQDWGSIKAEGETITSKYLALMDAGVPTDSPEAQEVAAVHREYFQRWFYDCSPEMFRELAQMWLEDERFRENIDKARPGLAAYQSAVAISWANSLLNRRE